MSIPIHITQNPKKVKDYVILKKLGAGFDGIVYKALDNKGRVVAVKQFDMDFKYNNAVSTLKAILDGCETHHIMCILDNFVENGKGYVVTQYIPGDELQVILDSLKEDPENTEFFLRQIATQLFTALAFIHSKGVSHGDIIESNIMYDPVSGEATLIDFGHNVGINGAKGDVEDLADIFLDFGTGLSESSQLRSLLQSASNMTAQKVVDMLGDMETQTKRRRIRK